MTDSRMFFFKLTNEVLNYLHFLAVKFLVFLRLFFPWLGEKRLAFEKLNESDPYAASFAQSNVTADFSFEVSSQGEFQQILELMKLFLQQGKKIELIYASESLENDISKFKQLYSVDQLRCLRLPIIQRSLFKDRQQLTKWVTANRFGFVRYDFYPHLLSLCFKKNLEMYLFWGSLKNKMNSKFSRWFWGNLANCFQVIFAANKKNQNQFQELNQQVSVYSSEMRTLSIEFRLQSRDETFTQKAIKEFVQSLNRESRRKVIFGSAYPEDLQIILTPSFIEKLKAGNDLIILAPHSLAKENIHRFKTELEKSDLSFCVFDSDTEMRSAMSSESSWDATSIILFTGKGVLCELYSVCDVAYIGGGFEKSIHSVLEPFWSGCQVVCGPKTHRSTEFDFCQELNPEHIRHFSDRHEISSQLVNMDTYKNDFHNRDTSFQTIIEQERRNIGNLL